MCLCRRVKKQMKRREEGEEERSNEGGISAKAAAWLCLNERTSHSHFLLLSVCNYGFCKRARPDQTQSRDSPSDFKLEVNIFQKLWLRVQHFRLLFVRLVPLSKKISTFVYLLLVHQQTYF